MSHRRTLLVSSVVAAALAVALAPACAGAASAHVAALQVALSGAGLSPGPVDGVTGPRTRGALRRFQARVGLAVDGIAGPRTRRALGRRGRPALGSRLLRAGRRGWDVAALQFLLRSRGYGPSEVDGGYGPHTRAAVVRYQRAAGLAADGIAGQGTLRALRTRRAPAAPGTDGPVRFLRPLAGAVGDGFGWVGGRRHTGIDIPAPSGAPVGAGGVGVVVLAGWNSGGYGNLVVVRHRLGLESWYAHLSRIDVAAGQAVAGGSRIGLVGATGRTTGPHLHFEVRRHGTPVDPVPWLLGAVSARASAVRVGRPLACRPNGDARGTRDADPARARFGRCP